jgi:hypothetical protein
MVEIVTQPDHGTPIASVQSGDERNIIATTAFQNFIDDLVIKLNESLFGNSIQLSVYTVATLPDVPDEESPGLIYVSDESGGAVPAFSDGSSWRRVTDRAVIS